MNCVSRSLFRFLLLPVVLAAGLATSCAAEDGGSFPPPTDFPACHQLTRQGIERLEGRLGIRFEIPFPKEADIDRWMKWPIAEVPAEGGKVYATKPFVNPWDGCGTVIWMLNDDPKQEYVKSLDIDLTLDEDGEFASIVIHRSEGNRWEDEEGGESQLDRDDSAEEKGPAFFDRAMKTYRQRAKKAEDPAQALRWLAALEKMSVAIQGLRKEQAAMAMPLDGAPIAESPKKAKYVEPKEPPAAQQVTKRAMSHLGEKLDMSFDMPGLGLPKSNAMLQQPLGWMAVGDTKILVSLPVCNSAAGRLSWLSGWDMEHLSGSGSVYFNSSGELVEFFFTEGNDWTYGDSDSGATISRGETESVAEFMKRGMETYRGRLGKASKPEQAKVLLEGFEKMLEAMQAVRTEEKSRAGKGG